MPRRSTVRLNKRIVDALAVERGDAVFWDREVSGFGVRVYASGRKIYVVQKRGPAGSPKRVSIGPSTDITVEEARREAAEIVDRLKRGEEAFPEPPAPEPTVADLAERYMKAHVEVNCRAGTVETFGRVVRLYILPELGHMRLSEVERSHVAALHHGMRNKPYQANQARNVLAKMFRLHVRPGADEGVVQAIVGGCGEDTPPGHHDAGDGGLGHGGPGDEEGKQGREGGREVLAARGVHRVHGRRRAGGRSASAGFGGGHGASPWWHGKRQRPAPGKDRDGARR